MNDITTNQIHTSKNYLKLDPISHCHQRPDMYIGTNRSRENPEFLYSNDNVIEFQDSVIAMMVSYVYSLKYYQMHAITFFGPRIQRHQ